MNIKDINKLNKDVLFLDIGKGMFDQKTLKILTKNKFKVFRLDVAPSLDMYVENSEIFKSMEKKKYNIRIPATYNL